MIVKQLFTLLSVFTLSISFQDSYKLNFVVLVLECIRLYRIA
jgi:hypothetical protein